MICKIANFFANFFQPKKIRKIRLILRMKKIRKIRILDLCVRALLLKAACLSVSLPVRHTGASLHG